MSLAEDTSGGIISGFSTQGDRLSNVYYMIIMMMLEEALSTIQAPSCLDKA